MEVGVVLGNGCGIQGQNFAELLHGSEMTARCHYRNSILVYNFVVWPLWISDNGVVGSNKLLNLGDNINWEYVEFDVELPMWKPWFDSREELNVVSPFFLQNWYVKAMWEGGYKVCLGCISWLFKNKVNWWCGNGKATVCWLPLVNGWSFFAIACVEIGWRWVHWQRGVGCVGG